MNMLHRQAAKHYAWRPGLANATLGKPVIANLERSSMAWDTCEGSACLRCVLGQAARTSLGTLNAVTLTSLLVPFCSSLLTSA